ncbi:hypothetical protein ANOM_002667 [Aspergillus nomiae NRRL 13137]|uniref:Uncharacterized protein n=1 Tax=Aspergillus nomiae NRRL (strain ATCC 15546 / NRRL 13137 / CBS 260.88 / M93) TaxID=1509407 RepID=A0A0L1JD66_ASPN3|nr:uncharacterized protein ANOM_002667 [Aspergillus nomiae NRRL 13137]KNG89363.1 hypothetical protein ANOM_002667 [Aspergillus nomiae NRRL 13137]
MKFPSLAKLATLAGLAFNSCTVSALTVGEAVVFPGYQCDSNGQVLQFDLSANRHVFTISGSGGAVLNWLNPGCSVFLCFAGYGCGDGQSGMQQLKPNTCLFSKAGDEWRVWDKMIFACD